MSIAVMHIIAICLGFCLDLVFGDPRCMPHFVIAIGHLIDFLEGILRKVFPKSNNGQFVAGIFLVIFVSVIPTSLVIAIQLILYNVSVYLLLAFDVFISYQILATKSLRVESMKVYYKLLNNDLPGARYDLSMIVGRDTENLDEKAIIKATVETVSENIVDGIIAPMIFLAIGGIPLGIFYKACNTMDSMIGYKNDKYMSFGRAAAIWDDILNFIPARLSGVLMCIAAYISGFDGKNAFKIFERDRKNHKSPNSAHTEAACAGALNIELAGDSYYFGKLVEKPTIGDNIRKVEMEDIPRSCKLMYFTSVLAIVIITLIYLAIIII